MLKQIIFLLVVLLANSLTAEEVSTFYGFNLGDSPDTVRAKLGDPDKIVPLDNNVEALVYFKTEHYVVFVIAGVKNHYIDSIQVTGKNMPKQKSMQGVNLGDSLDQAIQTLGPATETRPATDQETGEIVPDTTIYFYGENYSFEQVNGFVTSIKITRDKTMSTDNPTDQRQLAEQPDELIRVLDYIKEQQYPELFEEQNYRVAIQAYKIFDLDDDRNNEVIILFKPHYLQSPTIMIYQVNEHGAVSRLTEALAPGPLVQRADYFLDSHEIGQAIDFEIGEKQSSPEIGRKMALSLSDEKSFGLVVQYPTFFHADNRKGLPMYIDMTHVQPFSADKTCANFEFSAAYNLMVGSTIENENNYAFIAAQVNDEIYVYTIRGITASGMLEKELAIVPIKQ